LRTCLGSNETNLLAKSSGLRKFIWYLVGNADLEATSLASAASSLPVEQKWELIKQTPPNSTKSKEDISNALLEHQVDDQQLREACCHLALKVRSGKKKRSVFEWCWREN